MKIGCDRHVFLLIIMDFDGDRRPVASIIWSFRQNAKKNGVTKEEIAAIITHATMYTGWPKGWAVFRLAKEVWNETV